MSNFVTNKKKKRSLLHLVFLITEGHLEATHEIKLYHIRPALFKGWTALSTGVITHYPADKLNAIKVN